MVNSVSSMSVQTNNPWKKLTTLKVLSTGGSTSDASTEQTEEASNTQHSKRGLMMEELFASMRSSLRPELDTTSTSTIDTASAQDSSTPNQSNAGMMGLGRKHHKDNQSETIDLSSYDTDGDGAISRDEYETAMKGQNGVLSTDEFFAQVDTDSDDKISQEEFKAAVDASRPSMGLPPEKLQVIPSDIDTDGDSTLSTDEYDTLIAQMGIDDTRSADEFFKQYDLDSDGEISTEEILSGLKAAIDTKSQSLDTDNSASEASDNDSTSSQNVGMQTLSVAEQKRIARMLDAYESNFDYMFSNRNVATESVI